MLSAGWEGVTCLLERRMFLLVSIYKTCAPALRCLGCLFTHSDIKAPQKMSKGKVDFENRDFQSRWDATDKTHRLTDIEGKHV